MCKLCSLFSSLGIQSQSLSTSSLSVYSPTPPPHPPPHHPPPPPSLSPAADVSTREPTDQKSGDRDQSNEDGTFLLASVSIAVFVVLFGVAGLVVIIIMWWRHSQKLTRARKL